MNNNQIITRMDVIKYLNKNDYCLIYKCNNYVVYEENNYIKENKKNRIILGYIINNEMKKVFYGLKTIYNYSEKSNSYLNSEILIKLVYDLVNYKPGFYIDSINDVNKKESSINIKLLISINFENIKKNIKNLVNLYKSNDYNKLPNYITNKETNPEILYFENLLNNVDKIEFQNDINILVNIKPKKEKSYKIKIKSNDEKIKCDINQKKKIRRKTRRTQRSRMRELKKQQ